MFALDQADPVMLSIPLPDDTELGEAKVLILGNAASGKTTWLTRLEQEDADSSSQIRFARVVRKLREMPQPKSTIGIRVKELTHMCRAKMQVYDFAGQLEFMTVHESFLNAFNAIYVIVANAAAEDFRSQIRGWLQLLQTHPRGPKPGCGLLVLATCVDLVPGGAEAVKARECEIREEVASWGIAKMMQPRVEVVLLSNFTGEGLDRSWKVLRELAQAIASVKVPHAFKKAATEIFLGAQNAKVVFVPLPDLKGLITDRETKRELERADALYELTMHMHSIGVAAFEPASNLLCLNVQILAKMMSGFVASDTHAERLFKAKRKSQRFTGNDIVPVDEAITRMLELKIIEKLGGNVGARRR
jgi:GTPase SAR1 family protein